MIEPSPQPDTPAPIVEPAEVPAAAPRRRRTRRKINAAIAYDFDGTLAPGNMQERDFIPALGIPVGDFWREVKASAKRHDMDEILAYLELMLLKADAKELQINRSAFVNYGRQLRFFEGVEEWFDRINAYAATRGIQLEHYVISSGLREMIDGTSIRKHFKYVFASGFRYDQHHVAKWPALAVNYTNKTQFLFRINKGILNSYDNTSINKFMANSDRPLPFSSMLYIGDGETDIPCMKMLKHQGGRSIAVFPPRDRKGRKEAAMELVAQDRADIAVPADYSEGSRLEKVVQLTLDGIAAKMQLQMMLKEGS